MNLKHLTRGYEWSDVSAGIADRSEEHAADAEEVAEMLVDEVIDGDLPVVVVEELVGVLADVAAVNAVAAVDVSFVGVAFVVDDFEHASGAQLDYQV